MLISRHFSAIGNISRQKIDSGLNGFNVTVWLELPKWQYFTDSTADNLFKNLPIDFELQQLGWIKDWVVLGGNSCWGGWWVVWWLRWGESLQATSLLSLNPLQTTPCLSESEKYSLLHTQREIELTESEKYTVGGGVGERLHATSSLVVVAGQVKPHFNLNTTPCLSFSTPPHFCSATQWTNTKQIRHTIY